MSKIAVVTGTSSGIGFATALHFARSTFAGMRKPEKAGPLHEAARAESLPLEVIELDVTVPASVERAFARVAEAGPVDVLVNNAGIGGATPLELVPEDEHRQIFETNYFGAIRCIQAVLPEMRERKSGAIVNVTSIAGLIATANQIAYSASKFALEGLSESLALELRPFGIDVVLVQPGDVRSGFGAARSWTERARTHDVYRERAARAVAAMEQAERTGPPPERVAALVSRIVRARRPRLRYVCATPLERSALALQRLLPGRVFEAIVSASYDAPRGS